MAFYVKLVNFLLSVLSRYNFLDTMIEEIAAYLESSGDNQCRQKAQTILQLHASIKRRNGLDQQLPALRGLVCVDGRSSPNLNASIGLMIEHRLLMKNASDALRATFGMWRPMSAEHPSPLEVIALAYLIESGSSLSSSVELNDSHQASLQHGTSLIETVRAIIAEEAGVDFTKTSDLEPLELDPMTRHLILDSLREETGLLVPVDLLNTNPSIRVIEGMLKQLQSVGITKLTSLTANASLEARTLIGFIYAQRGLFMLAKKTLRDVMHEIEMQYGPFSLEYGIVVAECAKCCNMLKQYQMAEQMTRSTLL